MSMKWDFSYYFSEIPNFANTSNVFFSENKLKGGCKVHYFE